MELDWSTVALEILNFLVLVWLLKHFFYRPVLAVIEKRRADTEAVIATARQQATDAEALKADYTARLAALAAERELAMARLSDEIAAERERRLQALNAELATERERQQMLQAREQAERTAALTREAMQLAARFAGRLCERLASPALETRLLLMAREEIQAAPGGTRDALCAALQAMSEPVRFTTAFPLDAETQAACIASLAEFAGQPIRAEFSVDPSLLAGLHIQAGAWTLAANLRDELVFFAEAARHEH